MIDKIYRFKERKTASFFKIESERCLTKSQSNIDVVPCGKIGLKILMCIVKNLSFDSLFLFVEVGGYISHFGQIQKNTFKQNKAENSQVGLAPTPF